MKFKYLTILGFCLVIFSCKKESSTVNLQEAIITGYDMRLCGCCGGLMFSFDGNEEAYKGDFKIASELPASFQIPDTFPLHVKINFEETGPCNLIEVSQIEVQ